VSYEDVRKELGIADDDRPTSASVLAKARGSLSPARAGGSPAFVMKNGRKVPFRQKPAPRSATSPVTKSQQQIDADRRESLGSSAGLTERLLTLLAKAVQPATVINNLPDPENIVNVTINDEPQVADEDQP
jgi:hypothetical protein